VGRAPRRRAAPATGDQSRPLANDPDGTPFV
jgi:hypothetical protein